MWIFGQCILFLDRVEICGGGAGGSAGRGIGVRDGNSGVGSFIGGLGEGDTDSGCIGVEDVENCGDIKGRGRSAGKGEGGGDGVVEEC